MTDGAVWSAAWLMDRIIAECYNISADRDGRTETRICLQVLYIVARHQQLQHHELQRPPCRGTGELSRGLPSVFFLDVGYNYR